MTERPISAYLGVDKLEIMDEAINYNASLLAFVTARARSDDIIPDFGARPLAAQGCRVRCVEPYPDLRLRLVRAGSRCMPDSTKSSPKALISYIA
jgi:hypothetical protein